MFAFGSYDESVTPQERATAAAAAILASYTWRLHRSVDKSSVASSSPYSRVSALLLRVGLGSGRVHPCVGLDWV